MVATCRAKEGAPVCAPSLLCYTCPVVRRTGPVGIPPEGPKRCDKLDGESRLCWQHKGNGALRGAVLVWHGVGVVLVKQTLTAMKNQLSIIPATADHHGVSLSFTSADRARIVRVMRSGRDNGTIAVLFRSFYIGQADWCRKWGGGRACPVPMKEFRLAIESQRDMIEAHWSKHTSA